MHGRSIGGIAACRLERPVMTMGWSNWFGSWWRNQVPLPHHQSGTLHPPFNGFHGIYIIGHKTQKINFDLLYYIPTINLYLLFLVGYDKSSRLQMNSIRKQRVNSSFLQFWLVLFHPNYMELHTWFPNLPTVNPLVVSSILVVKDEIHHFPLSPCLQFT